MNCSLPGSSVRGKNSRPGKNPEVGYHFLLQVIFPTQGLGTWVFCIAERLFTIWATREALSKNKMAQMIEWVLGGEGLRAWMMALLNYPQSMTEMKDPLTKNPGNKLWTPGTNIMLHFLGPSESICFHSKENTSLSSEATSKEQQENCRCYRYCPKINGIYWISLKVNLKLKCCSQCHLLSKWKNIVLGLPSWYTG